MSESRIYLYHIQYEEVQKHLDSISRHLPNWRRRLIDRIHNPKGRIESAAAGRMLVISAADYLGISEERAAGLLERVQFGDMGKPYFPDSPLPYLNLSHSGGWIAVLCSDVESGVDLETKEDVDFRVTRRMFTEEEQSEIAVEGEMPVRGTSGYPKGQISFRRIWTEKESVLKCIGCGITIPLRSFTVLPDGKVLWQDSASRRKAFVRASGGDDQNLKEDRYSSINPDIYVSSAVFPDGKVLSAAARNQKITLDIQKVSDI